MENYAGDDRLARQQVQALMTDGRSIRIGLLGGTFNPVHTGHLTLARDAREAYNLDAVWFIPCGQPAHKPAHLLAPAAHRVAMLERAIAGEPAFSISRVEVDREGVSYAIDTVHTLQRAYPGREWFFIIGADTLPELPSWWRIEELLTCCRFVAMCRPGTPGGDVLKARINLRAPWPDRLAADVFAGHPVDIASSDIRKRVAENRPIHYLVPPEVARYIKDNQLYLQE